MTDSVTVLKVASTDDVQDLNSVNLSSDDIDAKLDDEKKKVAKYTGRSLAFALNHLEGISYALAVKLVEHITKEFITALSLGYRVYLRGLGSFYLVYHPAHNGRHPKTGETIWIEETLKIKFKPSSYITKLVNEKIQTIKQYANITDSSLDPSTTKVGVVVLDSVLSQHKDNPEAINLETNTQNN